MEQVTEKFPHQISFSQIKMLTEERTLSGATRLITNYPFAGLSEKRRRHLPPTTTGTY